jgi:hypothetical protein
MISLPVEPIKNATSFVEALADDSAGLQELPGRLEELAAGA